MQQPSNFLTDEYYNQQKLRLTKIKISKIFTAKIFHNMKKLYNTFFRGSGEQFSGGGGVIFLGGNFPGGFISGGNFPGNTFSGGIFPGGIFPGGIFPSTKFLNLKYLNETRYQANISDLKKRGLDSV